jgi:hypothetical protein
MRAVRLVPALVAATALLAPATASAQALPPSLTVDTNYAFSGVAKHDFTVTPGISEDTARGAAVDSGLDRHYAVGSGTTADEDIAVVARRSNGSLDSTFAGDGALALGITPGERDFGTAIAVLPDHRLRVLGATDTGTGYDLVLIGLLPNGNPDPAFGGGDGSVVFPVDDLSTADDFPARMAIADDGRIAVVGWTELIDDEAFVAVRDADGAPASFGDEGAVLLGELGDQRGVDVTWHARGPVALVQDDDESKLRAFEADGDDDPLFSGDGELTLAPDGHDADAGGLTAYGGWLWTTGSVEVAGDDDAFVSRVDFAGAGLQSRLFDMRGSVFPANQQVASAGLDLDVALGEPDTLVIGGSVTTDRGTEIAAAAFNGLSGALSAMQSGDAVISVPGQGLAEGVAAGANGVVALAGTLTDFSVETGSGSNDTSIGMARLVVDAEKQCDLSLTVAAPLELVIRGTAPAGVSLVARNGGQRACGGNISVPAPYSMTPGTLETGKLQPGESVTMGANLARPLPFPVEDTLAFTLSSPTDAAQGDNMAQLHVAFMFCDLRLVAAETPRFVGNEGTRRFGFSVRNVGTEACRATSIAVSGQGARAGGRAERYTVPAGQSVTDEMQVRLRRRGARVGSPALIAFTAHDAADLLPGDNSLARAPMIVRAGDTNARRPKGGRRFSGRAKDGRARGVRKRMLRLARVEIAVLKAGKGCRWLSSRVGDLRRVRPGRGGACNEPVWVRANGTSDWRLRLRRKLPDGRYTLFTRAVTRNGVSEGNFGFGDGNKLRFRVR